MNATLAALDEITAVDGEGRPLHDQAAMYQLADDALAAALNQEDTTIPAPASRGMSTWNSVTTPTWDTGGGEHMNATTGIWGLPTALGIIIVLAVGGVLAITHTIDWDGYFRDASILLAGLGIGHGIDTQSRP